MSCRTLTLQPDCRSARARRESAAVDYTAEQLLAAVLASVDDDKAEEVVQIDLRGRSDVADYMVICSGRSSRQVASISEKLADRLKAGLPASAPRWKAAKPATGC